METQRNKKWDRIWWKLSEDNANQITIIACMQWIITIIIDNVAYPSKKRFYKMNRV